MSKSKKVLITNKKDVNQKVSKLLKFPKIKTNNFCEENNKQFKQIHVFLSNPRNIIILMNSLKMMSHPKVYPLLVDEIKKNKKSIHNILKDFKTIMSFYKSNNLVLKSEVGHFILYYEYNLSKVKIKNDKDYVDFLIKIINYPKLISLLKEIFYILSDYRLCIYYMTPNIKFRNTNKENIDEFVKKFHNNQNMFFSIVSGHYPGSNSPWGKYYNGVYACFESLNILKKYYKDPLKSIKIEFKYKKKNNKDEIINKISNIYNIKLKKVEKILNITNFIILMKRLKYDMFEVVNTLFDIVYEKNTFKNIQNCYISDSKKLFNQKKSYYLGVKIFILVNNEYISNVNCFQNFVI